MSQHSINFSLRSIDTEGSALSYDSSPPKPLLKNRDHSGQRSVVIADKEFMLGQSDLMDKELEQLTEIAEQESGHKQPFKLGICLFMLSCVIGMNLLMPSDTSPSIIGIKGCSSHQFALQIFFVTICMVVTMIAIRVNQQEQ